MLNIRKEDFMIRTKLNILGIVTVMALALTGCFDENEPLFEEQQLEWEPIDRSTNDLDTTVEFEADEEEAETVTLRIQYAGEQQDEDFTAVFEVDEETDATEGDHFEVLTDNEVTVPASSSTSEDIEVEVDGANIENGGNFVVVLRITEDSDVEPMANYNEFEIFIEKDE